MPDLIGGWFFLGKEISMRISTVVVVLLILLTACKPVDEIDIDALYGVWHDDWTGIYSFMNEDGTFLVAETKGPEFPIQSGTYSLKGSNLTFVMDEKSAVCPGETLVVEAKFIHDDKYQETIIETSCDKGAGLGDTLEWIRVSP